MTGQLSCLRRTVGGHGRVVEWMNGLPCLGWVGTAAGETVMRFWTRACWFGESRWDLSNGKVGCVGVTKVEKCGIVSKSGYCEA